RSRKITGSVWREEFDDRPDLLHVRTVTFVPGDVTHSTPIQLIEEEYGYCEDVEAHNAIQRRVFHIIEGRIQLLYHYGRHRLLQPTRSFIKPADRDPTSLTPDMTQGFQPDPSVPEPTMAVLWATLGEELEAESLAQEEVRRAVEETHTLRSTRTSEEHNITLLPDIFDTKRNQTVQTILQERQFREAHREEEVQKKKDEREGKVDIIAPYLPLASEGMSLAGSELVRETCLQDLQERLAIRANLMQDRLDQ
ncbi:unnamed protein product, partial [Meganyctiphanes norvegica]